MSEKFQFQTARVHAVAAKVVLANETLVSRIVEQTPTVLSGKVLAPLPPHFSDGLATTDPISWVEARLKEGHLLALFDEAYVRLCGYLFLFETLEDEQRVVHIGYLFGENYWGQGLATELLLGLVGHCLETSGIDRLAAGVEFGNSASARVLEKAGFSLDAAQSDAETSLYALMLHKQ